MIVHVTVAGTEFTFSGDRELSIGRSKEADISLSSPYVSRSHGRLVPTAEGWYYEDLGSARGTLLQGRPITKYLLVGPQTLLLGIPGKGEEIRIHPQHESRIFICYRREDSSGHAGRLGDRLMAAFGPSQVFLDIDSIRIGENFRERVVRTISGCRAVLVVIGRTWLDSRDDQGRPRLENERDPVRLEIATALSSGSRVEVIPVLVQGAHMPAEDRLPPDLRQLCTRNALVAPDERWRPAVEHLVKILEGLIRAVARPDATGWVSSDQT